MPVFTLATFPGYVIQTLLGVKVALPAFLEQAGSPLHVSDLLARIHASFSVSVDRESLVSSLSKKVARGDRFLRTAKNSFALRPKAR